MLLVDYLLLGIPAPHLEASWWGRRANEGLGVCEVPLLYSFMDTLKFYIPIEANFWDSFEVISFVTSHKSINQIWLREDTRKRKGLFNDIDQKGG